MDIKKIETLSAMVKQLQLLDPKGFEHVVVQLFEKMGFDVHHKGKSSDGGIDAIAYLNSPITGGKYIIQCKRYSSNNVSVSEVRDLYGVVTDERAVKGILVTTSSFSKEAEIFASNKNIELVNGLNLANSLLEYDLGTVADPGHQSHELLKNAVKMGQEEGPIYLAKHGYDLTVDGDNWCIADNDPDVSEEYLSEINELVELVGKAQSFGEEMGKRFLAAQGLELLLEDSGAWAVRNGCLKVTVDPPKENPYSMVMDVFRGVSMVSEVGGFPSKNEKTQIRFRVNRSFGGVLKIEDEDHLSTEQDIVKLRQLAWENPNDELAVGSWIRFESDESLIAKFDRFPNSAYVHANLAAWHFVILQQYENSIESAQRVVNLLTENDAQERCAANYIFNLSVVYGMSELINVPLLVEKCSLAAPKNPYLRLLNADQLSGAARGTPQSSAFFEQLKVAVLFGDKRPSVLSPAAILLARNGYTNQSLKCARRCESLAETIEDRILADFAMGVSLLNADQSEAAVIHFQSVLKHDDDHLDAKSGLAAALCNSGNEQRGFEIAKECLAIDPENEICQNITANLADGDRFL